ncbi:GerMN domain-containing protein [Ornithinimicrobium flavum]|uniref:GerMN domain-containing protein n=1 Tax=Ornithinimicrobium flavum TaxID=1288636 RepID=UPI00106FAFE1|nr:LpqB family beta-propeller domain-containing protein [Ornithinimicrobium flavum]
MTRHPSAGRRRTGLLVVAVLVLGGCSSQLPTSPQPRAGLPVSVQARPDVERILNPPQPGATAAEVVRGFLQANVGFADDGDVPRSYLTAELASRWVPTSAVLVVDGTPEVTSVDGREVTVAVQVAGRIDAEGRLLEQTSTSRTTQSFTMSRVGQEWRISAFPEGFGVWLTRADLEQSFRPTTLYYLNPHGNTFVPEVRWLPVGDGRPTALVRAQLAPVPDHLEGAVRTAVTDDVRLGAASVPVDPRTSVAVVQLTGAGLAADTQLTAALQAQLAHALLALPGVSGVQVQLAGQPLTLGQDGPITASTQLPYHDVERNVDMVLLRVGTRFRPIDATQSTLRDLPQERTEALELPELGASWTDVAASADLQDFAAVSVDRTSFWRWRQGVETSNDGIGDALTPPAVDPLGGFWIGGVSRSTGEPRIWIAEPDDLGTARPLEVPWLHARDRLHMISVSPDGSRAVLVVADTSSERRRMVLAGVERDGAGRPVGLTEGVPVAPHLSDVATARWASAGDLYLVARRPDDPRMRVFSLRVGEWLSPIGARDALEPVDVLPVPRSGGAEPIARTADGRFHTTEGSGWYGARNGDELVVPGG